MPKIQSGTLTAGTVKSNLKRTVERFVASGDDFPFTCSVKGTLTFRKKFIYDLLAGDFFFILWLTDPPTFFCSK